MQPGEPNQISLVLFAILVVLGLFSSGFFFLSKNAPLKRKAWPPFVAITGVVFAGFV